MAAEAFSFVSNMLQIGLNLPYGTALERARDSEPLIKINIFF